MLGAMSPSWKNAPSKFPASANITHQDFTGVMLWYCAFVPLVLLFPPEKLQKPFIFSSAAFGATLIGLLAWAVPNAGGGGPLFKTANTADSTSFSMMLGITSILSSWGAGTIGQSDWVGRNHDLEMQALMEFRSDTLRDDITHCCRNLLLRL
jgi:NCS1 family nucleobase:cation symporter-1